METKALIDLTTTSALPAPYWFVELFKIIGFILHIVPMNLWFVGFAVAVYLYARGNEHGKKFGSRLIRQMPIIVAFGINLGIVPLLFLQLAYNKAFYPATILMAWFWFAVVGFLIFAYYGVYVLAYGVQSEPMAAWRRWGGRIAVGCFIVISLIFAHAMTLTAHTGRWSAIWLANESSGAATGLGLDVTDFTVLPRWLLMVGLAVGTTAAWALIDSVWLATKESDEYREWIRKFAEKMFYAGAGIAVVAGGLYTMLTSFTISWSVFFGIKSIWISLVAAGVIALPALLMWKGRELPLGRKEANLIAIAQLGVLVVQAISRQLIQNYELRRWGEFDPAMQETATQWSPLLAFLILFVAGLAVVGWMVLQVIKAEAKPNA